MTEERFDALAREAATEEARCICGHVRAAHIYHEGACRPGFICLCPMFQPDPFAPEAVQFVHDALDAAFEKRRRNLLAAERRDHKGE